MKLGDSVKLQHGNAKIVFMDKKEAVASMVQRALFLAADTVQEWLPSAFWLRS